MFVCEKTNFKASYMSYHIQISSQNGSKPKHKKVVQWWRTACSCRRHETRDTGATPGPGRCPGEGNGHPLQFSCLENSRQRSLSMRSQRVGHDWATEHKYERGKQRRTLVWHWIEHQKHTPHQRWSSIINIKSVCSSEYENKRETKRQTTWRGKYLQITYSLETFSKHLERTPTTQ